MKKIIISSLFLMLGVAFAQAQTSDTLERNMQQQKLLQEQEQKLLEQQQAEAKALVEQQKAKADQAKAEKQQQRAARRAEIERSSRLAISPIVGYSSATRMFQYAEAYNAAELNVAATLEFYYPLSKRWDVGVGAGARFSMRNYRNSVWYDTEAIVPLPYRSHLHGESYANQLVFLVPVRLLRYDRKNESSWFVGLNVGYHLKTTFGYRQLQEDHTYGDLDVAHAELTNPAIFNRWRLEAAFGFERKRRFIFSPGVELYFNLLPTYVKGSNGGNPIHELGLRLSL